MTTGVERKDIDELVKERPEEIELPEEIERLEGVRATKVKLTAKVQDEKGRDLIRTSDAERIVQLPSNESRLTSLSKGSLSDSITWFANFWLRMIKKAIHFGWKIVDRSGKDK